MNDIFLDLRDAMGKQIFVNERNIVSLSFVKCGTCIQTVTGGVIYVEESPVDIYVTILHFQSQHAIHVIH